MAVVLDLGGIRATVQDGKWTCGNVTRLKLLNTLTDPLGPNGNDPHPDLTLAQKAVKLFGKSAKIVAGAVQRKSHKADPTIIP